MKAVLGRFVVAAALAAAGVANAGMLSEEIEPVRDAGAAAPKASPAMTSREQWACEVALCMANPNGPMAVSACVAPIKKMYREIAKGNVIPRCKFLGSRSGGGGDTGGGGNNQHARQQQR